MSYTKTPNGCKPKDITQRLLVAYKPCFSKISTNFLFNILSLKKPKFANIWEGMESTCRRSPWQQQQQQQQQEHYMVSSKLLFIRIQLNDKRMFWFKQILFAALQQQQHNNSNNSNNNNNSNNQPATGVAQGNKHSNEFFFFLRNHFLKHLLKFWNFDHLGLCHNSNILLAIFWLQRWIEIL